jgi:DNA-binding transcriptional regulator LsrR (DeoR family)
VDEEIMARNESPDQEIDMLAAALLAVERRKYTDIAETLGLNPTKIFRLLAKAKKEHYLYNETRFLHDKVPIDLMQKVQRRIARKELTQRLQSFPKEVDHGPVVRVFGCTASASNPRERIAELGRRAAPYLSQLLLRSRVCGLTWGGMLRGVVSALRDLQRRAPWKQEIVECIPLSGERLGVDRVSFSSSSLAHDLGEIVNGEKYTAPSLAMVPAFIPEGFSNEEINGVWKLIGLVKSYDAIFGKQGSVKTGEPPMACRVCMILSSVGPATRPLGFGRGRLFETGNISIEELQHLVIGDLGGVCIARPDLTKRSQQKLQTIIDRWTGLKLEHIQACSTRARNSPTGPPGVVVVSGGKSKAQFIWHIAKLGLVNHLIIDEELAEELDKIVDRKSN